MAWAETMYIIKHLDKKLEENVESKLPFIAKNINGLPEGINIEKLKPGAIWYIEENNSEVSSFSIFTSDRVFSEPIPLNAVIWND